MSQSMPHDELSCKAKRPILVSREAQRSTDSTGSIRCSVSVYLFHIKPFPLEEVYHLPRRSANQVEKMYSHVVALRRLGVYCCHPAGCRSFGFGVSSTDPDFS